jgi:hypothetical protein
MRASDISRGRGGVGRCARAILCATRDPLSAGRGSLLCGWSLAALVALRATAGLAQEAPTPLPSLGPLSLTPYQDQGVGPAGDPLTPQNLLQLEYQVKTTPGTNLNGEPDTVTTDTMKLRGDLSFNLSPYWQLVFRGDLPYVAKDAQSSETNPDGTFVYGWGDSDVQAALINEINARWKAGAGVRFVAPTGGDYFGSGKWQVQPVAGFRYALPEIGKGVYYETLKRWT